MVAIVVDDSRMMRTILRKFLVGQGFHVAEAANGREALDLLEARGGADLITVDTGMPVMDGVSFIREARKDPRWSRIPVLVASGEADLPTITAAIEAGADEFLIKPFDAGRVREKLQALGWARGTAGPWVS